MADLDKKAKLGLTQEEIKYHVTTADENRQKIVTEVIEEPIFPPGIIMLEDPREEPHQKRVSLPHEVLMKKVIQLFNEKSSWKVEEIAEHLQHPKEPINKLLK